MTPLSRADFSLLQRQWSGHRDREGTVRFGARVRHVPETVSMGAPMGSVKHAPSNKWLSDRQIEEEIRTRHRLGIISRRMSSRAPRLWAQLSKLGHQCKIGPEMSVALLGFHIWLG